MVARCSLRSTFALALVACGGSVPAALPGGGSGGSGGDGTCPPSSAFRSPYFQVRGAPEPVKTDGRVAAVLLEHRRLSEKSGVLVLQPQDGSRFDVSYTVDDVATLPPLASGDEVEIEATFEEEIFYWNRQIGVFREGLLAWAASSTSFGNDAFGLELTEACEPPGPGEQLQVIGFPAHLIVGDLTADIAPGESVTLADGAVFELIAWRRAIGCCADPPRSQAWVYARAP